MGQNQLRGISRSHSGNKLRRFIRVSASGPSNHPLVQCLLRSVSDDHLQRANSSVALRVRLISVSAMRVKAFERTELTFYKRFTTLVTRRFPISKGGKSLTALRPESTLVCHTARSYRGLSTTIEAVEHWGQVSGEQQHCCHPANDYDGQRSLGLGANLRGKRGRQQAAQGSQVGHHHRSHALSSPLDDRPIQWLPPARRVLK